MLLLDLDPPPACLPTISSHLAGCRFYRAHSRPRRFSMLPASDLTEILANLSALNLQPSTAAAVLGALAPLLRTAETPPAVLEPQPSRRPRSSKRARGARRKRKYKRHAPSEARDRALAALRANPDATPTEIAKIAKVSPSTVV